MTAQQETQQQTRKQEIDTAGAASGAASDAADAPAVRSGSPTRRALDDAVVRRLVAAGLPGAQVESWQELSGGEFAAVARVTLRDGREVVLKVGPDPAVPVLAYEHGMIGAETRYLAQVRRALPGVPVADLLAHGRDIPGDGVIAGEWMLVSLLPGRSLNLFMDEARETGAPDPSARVREQLGAVFAQIHTLTSPDGRFGYDDDARPHGSHWPAAYTAIIESLLADAEDWHLQLPASPERIRAAVRRHEDALAQVQRPALVHFDLWDGNVLAAPGPGSDTGVDSAGTRTDVGALKLTGLVDGERYLYGDPLIDFVSPAIGRRIEDEPEHPFVAGYRAVAGWPDGFTADELRRLALYRLHLYLLMYVEMPSRGMDRTAHAWRWEWMHRLLLEELDHLEALRRRSQPTQSPDPA